MSLMGKMRRMSAALFSNKSNEDEPAVVIQQSTPSLPSGEVVEMYENERWRDDLGWSSRYLEVGDPQRFCSGSFQCDRFTAPPPPAGYAYINDQDWVVDTTLPHCDGGWCYAESFRQFQNPSTIPHGNIKYSVRRKRYVCGIYRFASPADDEVSVADNEDSVLGLNAVDDADAPVIDEFEEEAESVGADEEETSTSEVLSSTTSGVVLSKVGGVDNIPIIRDPVLLSIGKQLRQLESDCKREDETRERDWKKNSLPSYKSTIKELERRVKMLVEKMQAEAHLGVQHEEMLKEEWRAALEVLESTKKNIYFPNSAIVLGQAGVYIGLDDLWIEHASGQFVVDLVPNPNTPQIIVLLTGTSSGTDSGVSVRVQLEGFKLKGDAGKGVPQLSFDSVKVTVVVRVTIMLTFDVATCKWVCSAKHFTVEILSFKGPFGTRRNVVAATLAIVTPLIRSQIVDALPIELGLLIKTLPAPFSVRGEFNIIGTELHHLSETISKSNEMVSLMGYSKDQLARFIALQKCMERDNYGTLIKTMHDLLQYRKLGLKHHRRWDQIKSLWNQAMLHYYEKTRGEGEAPVPPPLCFERFLQATEEILRKPHTVDFSLQHLDGTFSLREIVIVMQQIIHRWTDTYSTTADLANLIMVLNQLQTHLDLVKFLIRFLNDNLDTVEMKLQLKLTAGEEGVMYVQCSDITAKMPLAVYMAMPKEISVGYMCPVPFVVTIKPKHTGEVIIEMSHVGSEDMSKRAIFIKNNPDNPRSNAETPPPPEKSTGIANLAPRSSDSVASSAGHSESGRPPLLPAQPPTQQAHQTVTMINSAQAADTSSTSTPHKRLFPMVNEETCSSIDEEGSVTYTEDQATPLRVKAQLNSSSSLDQFSYPPTPKSSTNGSVTSRKPYNGTKFVDTHISPSEEQRQEIERVLSLFPRGLASHKILVVTAYQPEVDIIVDTPVTLQPGTSLLSFRLGPVDAAWKPHGFNGIAAHQKQAYHSTLVQTEVNGVYGRGAIQELLAKRLMKERGSEASSASGELLDEEEAAEVIAADLTETATPGELAEAIGVAGCPMFVQTGNGVKVVAKVPYATVDLHMARVWRFLLAFLRDLQGLRDFLGVTTEAEAEVADEVFALMKVLLDRLGKYVLLPNFSLRVNLNLKLSARDQEVTLSMETPFTKASGGGTSNSRAVHLKARLNVMDIIADALAVQKSVVSTINAFAKFMKKEAPDT